MNEWKKSITTLRKVEIVRTETSREYETLYAHYSWKGKSGSVSRIMERKVC